MVYQTTSFLPYIVFAALAFAQDNLRRNATNDYPQGNPNAILVQRRYRKRLLKKPAELVDLAKRYKTSVI